jgi:hypothetical protein
VDERRWIAPHFRGSQEIGVVERQHYEVGRG